MWSTVGDVCGSGLCKNACAIRRCTVRYTALHSGRHSSTYSYPRVPTLTFSVSAVRTFSPALGWRTGSAHGCQGRWPRALATVRSLEQAELVRLDSFDVDSNNHSRGCGALQPNNIDDDCGKAPHQCIAACTLETESRFRTAKSWCQPGRPTQMGAITCTSWSSAHDAAAITRGPGGIESGCGVVSGWVESVGRRWSCKSSQARPSSARSRR